MLTYIILVITEETKTTWRMPRELLKDLKRYALENDTNVTAVVLRACKEFLAKDKMFKEKYSPYSVQYEDIRRLK